MALVPLEPAQQLAHRGDDLGVLYSGLLEAEAQSEWERLVLELEGVILRAAGLLWLRSGGLLAQLFARKLCHCDSPHDALQRLLIAGPSDLEQPGVVDDARFRALGSDAVGNVVEQQRVSHRGAGFSY